MLYNITNRDGETTIALFPSNGLAQSVPATHAKFAQIVEHLTTRPADEHDEALILRLLDPAAVVAPVLAAATDGRMVYRDNNVFVDGLPVTNTVAQHILDNIDAGDEDAYVLLSKFWMRLNDNPSHQAQVATYKWVTDNGLTILPDGRFLGYKSVNANGLSSSSGPNNFIDGVLLGTAGVAYNVPHRVGTVVSKRRADVDDNRSVACSTGLHVGTRDYASRFANRLLMVAIDPADVVSIPDNDLTYKIRVASYEILGPANHAAFTGSSYVPTSRDEVTADEYQFAVENEWLSDSHAFADEAEQDQYDSLDHVGRTLYDNLRTQFAKSHEAAYLAALDHQETVDALEEAEEVFDVVEDEEAEAEAPKAKVLDDFAQENDDLRSDLLDRTFGHKPLARKWASVTTESSVRRWRKAHNVSLTLGTKIQDALD